MRWGIRHMNTRAKQEPDEDLLMRLNAIMDEGNTWLITRAKKPHIDQPFSL